MGMAPGPLRIRIEGEEAERLLALARSEGLVLVESGAEADLVARPAKPTADSVAPSPERPPRAGPKPPRRSEAPGATSRSLSRRELEILDYLVDGWSNAEIASALCLKVRTVRFHLEGIYAKLGVARRGEAVREVLRLGLLRFDA
jgi:ATP/maltotriose-dependent transcriptional regulator MalT